MKPLFGDTGFFVAYLNPKDLAHGLAEEYLTRSSEPIVTTAWVLVELGNFLAEYRSRRLYIPLVRQLRSERRFTIVEADRSQLERGLQSYARYRDKQWSMTDCISFLVMKERGLTRALTQDHHFEQAGFTALLK